MWAVDVQADGGQQRGGSLTDSDRLKAARPGRGTAPLTIADPRGLAGATPQDLVQSAVGTALNEDGLDSATVGVTLLAAGPLGVRGDQYGELYGMTHPSGATEVWLATYLPVEGSPGFQITRFPPAPVGQALMDRVIAVSAMAGLLVSAPEGAEAQVLDRAGAVLTTIPLTQGAGTGPMGDPAAAKVRVLDAAGNLVGEGPVTREDR
jgi:hypothetical protein